MQDVDMPNQLQQPDLLWRQNLDMLIAVAATMGAAMHRKLIEQLKAKPWCSILWLHIS